MEERWGKCPMGGGLWRRHQKVGAAFFELLTGVRYCTVGGEMTMGSLGLDLIGLFIEEHNKRPDLFATLPNEDSILGDVALIHPIQDATHLHRNAKKAGAAAKEKEGKKHIHYDDACRAVGIRFVPLVFETYGRPGGETVRTWVAPLRAPQYGPAPLSPVEEEEQEQQQQQQQQQTVVVRDHHDYHIVGIPVRECFVPMLSRLPSVGDDGAMGIPTTRGPSRLVGRRPVIPCTTPPRTPTTTTTTRHPTAVVLAATAPSLVRQDHLASDLPLIPPSLLQVFGVSSLPSATARTEQALQGKRVPVRDDQAPQGGSLAFIR
uniref:Uncharacterized protein n=1 Tax=Chromera velia CCMP2878 TaxID=1169474 RepID=A0A0G4HYV9_9ALVE|eukprot:Cvel_9576.t1-p1 / transcript=Cvel_9576.t1 / gene=Cvel_9576 / organism=Chromera_velia_CCMP2878 / gene_product=hypothetical protein / transcript_product=hypothetical protein / location=Cvel_scaffold555:36596-40201(-) / protein_length=318 / sequence_SO=supercontig / SO=protein_coding / is_pseudo=false